MPRVGLTRERLVRQAGYLADRSGLAAVSLSALADHFGVRVPSLYKHVHGLDDLRTGLALDGLRELDTILAEAVGDQTGRDALVAFANAYRRFATARPGLYSATQRRSVGDRGPEADEVAGRVVDLALGIVGAYGLAGAEAIHAVRFVRSALHGFVTLETADGFGMPLDPDVSFDRLGAMLDAGLLAWASTRPTPRRADDAPA